MARHRYRLKKEEKQKKKEGFFSKIFNGVITLALTFIMLWGLQAYSRASSSDLTFAQVSDVHFLENGANTTFKMIQESPKLLDDAISQINEGKNVDFVMFTGDLIDKPFEKELRAVFPHLDKLNTPWYFAFGNHDRCVGGYLTTEVYLQMLRDNNKNFKSKKAYYSFEPKKDFKAIVLDDAIDTEITSNGFIDDEQIKWLKKELDNAKDKTVLIFMHIPIIEPFPSPNHRLRNSSEVKALIESYKNPIGVFQGHYHATKIVQHDNVIYAGSPALVSYPNAFRVVKISNTKDKTNFEFIWKETRKKEVQNTARMMVFAGGIYTGTEKDQTGIYTVTKK